MLTIRRRLAIPSAALDALMLTQGSLLSAQGEGGGIPRLRKQGTATQLVVDGEPFLILGGELGNSTASSVAGMRFDVGGCDAAESGVHAHRSRLHESTSALR